MSIITSAKNETIIIVIKINSNGISSIMPFSIFNNGFFSGFLANLTGSLFFIINTTIPF